MFTPPASSTSKPTGTPTAQSPAHTSASLSNRVGEGQGEAAPWQRLDATWPVIANSPSKLDGDAQRLVRSLLTQAAGEHLKRRRQLDAASLWIWEPRPHLAEYVRQRRFFASGLYHLFPPDLFRMLRAEASLGLELLTTPPSVVGVEVWQELLALQCQRIGQLYAALQHTLGRLQAQEALQAVLEGLT
jgi:hypothetical protein